MIKHYATILYPGLICSDTSTVEVESRDPDRFQIPDRAFGFQFWSRTEVEVEGEVLKGEPQDYSAWYYVGTERTLEDVKRDRPGEHVLISNMVNNKYDRVVMTRFGQSFLLNAGDVVLSDAARMRTDK
jgi:hypothetical protein